jgi:two-component sensor histidine kinase
LSADLATPLAVTVTELIQNSIEHGFPDQASGTVTVALSREPGEVVVVVRDDGVGIKDDAWEGSRLGLQIVNSLISELGGSFHIASQGGTKAEVRIPIDPKA